MLKLLAMGLLSLTVGSAHAESWEELCKTPESTALPEAPAFCRVKSIQQAATANQSGVVASECYSPGTNYPVNFSTEVREVTVRFNLDRPVQVQSTSLAAFRITLPIDRRYLCHRLQRQIVFHQITPDQAARVITDLIRLGSYVKNRGLATASAEAQTYVQRSIAAQLSRALTDAELSRGVVSSFRTRYPVRSIPSLAQ